MGRVVTDDGVELWVEVTGSGDGVPLVLCHGGPGLWDDLGGLAALVDGERRVVRWDQRGCGRSDGAEGPFTVDRFVADLEAVRRGLGIDRWVVGGHSWGASLVLQSVLTHPASAMGLLYVSGTGAGRAWHAGYKAAPAERLTSEQLARCAELEAEPDRSWVEEVEWRTLRWAPDFADRERAFELAAIDAEAPWPINRACNAAINAETKTWDEGELLEACSRIVIPTLFVHGADDPRHHSAIEGLAEAIPRAEVELIAAAGHSPWLERPGAVASALRRWLRSIDSA